LSESDQFGFLPINRSIVFDDGAVEPLPSLDTEIVRVRQGTHRDGYLYPPRYHDHALHVFEPLGEETERPAHLHRMPPSHVLRLDCASAESGSPFRRGDGAFLMHFVALMFGYRLQFHEWWFDTRLPMFPRRWRLPPPQHLEGRFLTDAYRTWRSWPSPERIRFVSLLYMHVRSTAYEWDWERFAVNYMIFDGCYKMAVTLKLMSAAPSHAARFNTLFQWLHMPTNDPATKELVRFRNDLFHEALWDRRQPGAGSRAGYVQADHLSRINDRLLFALAGYRGQYLSTPWWVIGQASLAP
jgi:hypothetical protein